MGSIAYTIMSIETWVLAALAVAGLVVEAKALLHHTSWSTAEIAYSLGFEYPTYFNNFFKKHTGTTPLTFRRAQVTALPAEGTTAS